MTGEWHLGATHGETARFHADDPRPVRSAVVHTVARPTLVLGSVQRHGAVNRRVADALGVDVVGRRSGGGAVLLLPGEFVWLDLVIPRADPLWVDDVGRAMVWVGRLWQAALADLGVAGRVHEGGLVRGEWSSEVCWASLGTGEVVAADRPGKLVGVSQRRTRQWARFQSMVHLRWRPELVAALVAPSPGGARPSAALLAPAAATLGGSEPPDAVADDGAAVRAALVRHLPR